MRHPKGERVYYLFWTLFLLIFTSCGDRQVGQHIDSTVAGQVYREGEILVRFKSGVDTAKIKSMHRAVGASIMRRFATLGIELVTLPRGLTVEDAIKAYRTNPEVEYAEPNYIVRKAILPNDTDFNVQWGLNNIGQSIDGITGISDSDIDAPEAWDIHTGDGVVVVAVIDTGIDYNHPDLSENIWINPDEIIDGIDNDGNGYVDDIRGWDFAYYDNDPMDDDIDSHGTHVAGIIGGVGNNGIGISGVVWRVRLMPIKVLDSSGFGTISDVVAGIEYAIKKGVKVINASYTYPQACIKTSPSQAERDAIKAAGDVGILFIVSAGNYGCNNDIYPFYPASHLLPNIISVAASDQKDNKPSWSNYGAYSVDVAAPGMNIYSTTRTELGGYGYLSGSSMAAPFVSGLAALIASNYPDYTYQEIKAVILASVDIKASMDDKLISGGRINAFSALSSDPKSSVVRPSGLSHNAVSGPSVTLIWKDNSSDEDGFRIERKTGDGGIYREIGSVSEDTTKYVDSSLQEGHRYYYRVRAYKGDYYSRYSNEITVTIPPNSPSNLVVIGVSSSQINLSWTDNSSAEEGFKIERKMGLDGAYSEIAIVGADVTTYSDKGLSPGTTYYYRVRAYNDLSGGSAYSNEAWATTLLSQDSSGGGRNFNVTIPHGRYFYPDGKVNREF